MSNDLWLFMKAVGLWWFVVLGTSILGLAWSMGQQPTLAALLSPRFWAPPLVAFAPACFYAWREQHHKVQELTAKLLGSGPKPNLLLTYDGGKLLGRPDDDATEPHLAVHNDGARAAVNIRFERVVFNRNYSMQIEPIQMIGPYAAVKAKFQVDWTLDEGGLDEGGQVLETPKNLGAIVWTADFMARANEGKREDGLWPIVIHYIDSDGKLFRSEYEMHFGTATRQISLTLMPSVVHTALLRS